MTPHIPWQKRFLLGVEDTDLQHRYFLNLINRMIHDQWIG